MSHQIIPDQKNDNIEIGRLIHEKSYKKNKKEIKFGAAKFDFVSRKSGTLIVSEIKKSSKYTEASKMQLAYYLYLLKKEGVSAKGELLIPTEKKKIKVELNDKLIQILHATENKIAIIIQQDKPPEVKKINFCKNCAYKEFCFS